MGTLALIGLGSNLGDRKAALDAAVSALAATPGIEALAVSSYHETTPIGGPNGQGAFLNAAARLQTTLGPRELLCVLHAIEHAAGRLRTVRWGERTLDLDLLIFGCKFLDTPELELPHPRLGIRRFVLAPLAEIAPTIVDTTNGLTVAQLLANLDRRPSHVALLGGDPISRAALAGRLLASLPSAAPLRPWIPPARPQVGPESSGTSGEAIEDQIRGLFPDQGPKARAEAFEWSVSVDYPGRDRIRDVHLSFRRNLCLRVESRHKMLLRLNTLEADLRVAWNPTFAVILGDWDAVRRRPQRGGFPKLWPEARDLPGLEAEVLAACAATRPG